ncbi:KLTH0G18414p [Lachancea thermotolerans CBS 6340]|uniref:KLTH0G18414p n=1 Tax=Lachancea thermotolerans (strain ATCC 56472 / CBS 6340 / NRRL Y-8284) TaxID=559295 RepID=C5DNM8_LACTC|nr:KLTH0G18414p [Lachancea thermotolerans CBS 6340]CAR25389.1 KLTH0G18414p [Lachancea thermotolerans CBS 6340]
MSQNASDILRLPAMACSAEQQVSGAPSSVCSSHSNLTSSPADSGAKLDKSEQPGLAVACTRRARNFWSVHEDTVLVATIIDNTAFLRGPANTRPRSRFWLHISFELKVRHGLSRNKRQCRDRFNLLFWKAVRDHRSSRKDLKKLDRLLAQCLTILYIDKNNVIMLKEQAPSSAATPCASVTSNGTSALVHSSVPHANSGGSAAAAATGDDPLHSPPRCTLSPTTPQGSLVGSSADLADSSFEAFSELAAGLQQQVSSLNQRVEELCGMLAMERSRVDYLLTARTGVESPSLYQPPLPMSHDMQVQCSAGVSATASAANSVFAPPANQYLAMTSPYLAVASPYSRAANL